MTMTNTIFETDVMVAGGGPAGLAAAIAAQQAGLAATVVDCAKPPIDKVCGEGIMPDGLFAMSKLGVQLPDGSAHPFRGIRFTNGKDTVDAAFPQGMGLGMRRPKLHQALIDRAAELGVAMHWGVRITGVSENGVMVNGHNVRCRWLIGADGQNSALRQWSGLDTGAPRRRRFGFRRHFSVAPWSEFVEIHWSYCGQLYITPVSPDEICVVFISSIPGIRLDRALVSFPEVAAKLKYSDPLTREQGAMSITRKLRSIHCGNLALIGEAAGSVDAITGEGLSMAFQQAVALAEAMKANDLRGYQLAHRKITRLPRFMAELMLTMDSRHGFRNRVFRAFSAEPSLFSRLLAMHTGALSPFRFGMRDTLSLSWRLITA